MKKTILKSICACLLLSLALLSLSACAGGIDTETADAFIEDFFAAIEKENYNSAKTFFHPDRFTDIEAYVKSVEAEKGIDFSNGITVQKRTNVAIAYYDSDVDGSRYGMTLKAKVGEVEVKIDITVVQSENGYGVYEFEIR